MSVLSDVVVDTCDQNHKFAKLPDHPMRDGKPRCPHCLSIGHDRLLAWRTAGALQLPVELKDDHKLKDQSVEATVTHTVDGKNTYDGHGTIEYNLTGYGKNASEALEGLKAVGESLGNFAFVCDPKVVSDMDADVKRRYDESRLFF